MGRLRIGVIGAGLVAQIEHIPNLLRLSDRFAIGGVSDPSAVVRTAVGARFGLPTFPTAEALLARPLDAVLIAAPDPLHHELVLAAFAAGLHVLCEKPLCYGPAEIDDLIAARDLAGKVLQVGTMKRFDPSYAAALAMLPGTKATLRAVSVEVVDPDAWPFIGHHAHVTADDVPAALIEATRAKRQAQVEAAVGSGLDATTLRGFTGALSSGLVHDVNAVHGLLDGLGVPDGEITGASLFAGGDGCQGTVRLLDGQALWTMMHLAVPGLPDYRERIALMFDDAMLELVFPSPWLNHQPTRLILERADGHVLHATETRSGYEEAFIEELKGFWSAVVEAAPVRNTAEHARRDAALLTGLARWHAGARLR